MVCCMIELPEGLDRLGVIFVKTLKKEWINVGKFNKPYKNPDFRIDEADKQGAKTTSDYCVAACFGGECVPFRH